MVMPVLRRLRQEDGKLEGKMMEKVKRSMVAGSREVRRSRWGIDEFGGGH